MPYIGNTPADKFLTLAKQSFSTSATTSYTLDNSVSSTQDIALFINSVRQSPVDAYTVSGTSLTLTSATAGTDEMYCVYLGKTVGTVSPASDSVTTAMIQSNAVNNAKMADDAIGLAELSATGTPSSSNFLRGDNSWASAGGDNTPMWYVERTSDQSLTKNTYTKIEWDHEEIDTDSAFASYKFTVPSGEAGKYYITAGLGFYDNTEQAHHYVQIYKNGSNISATPSGISTVADDTDRYWQTNTMIADLAVSDYIEIYGYFGALGTDTTATVNYSYFTGYKLIT